MFNPARALHENPALFACYVLYVYFRGRNAVRIEREMRSLGFTTFHRRNLYPRGRQPGWIARFGWQQLSVPPAIAGGSTQPIGPTGGNAAAHEHSYRTYERSSPPYEGGVAEGRGGSLVVSPDSPPSAHGQLPTEFHAWLKRVSPKMTWDWKHQQVIIDQLNRVTTGDCKRLMIFLPPRHGKSELVSVRYTAWRMQRQPELNVILGSYNQRLADRMSRKIRTVICDSESMHRPACEQGRYQDSPQPIFKQDRQDKQDGKREPSNNHPVHPVPPVPVPYEQGSPFPFSRPRPKNAVSEWETASGGSFRAVGSGSGVTGFGANLIVIDDPVKNRAQAESETFRNRVWDWYKDDLYTRLEPDGSIVLIQTRWHEDDLAGRLLRENLDDWTIINLPALSERNADALVRNEHEVRTPSELKQDAQDKQDAEGGNTSSSECAPSVPLAVAGGGLVHKPAREQGRYQDATDNGGNTSSSECAPQSPTTNMESKPLDHQEQHPSHPVHPVTRTSFEWRTAPNVALCPERFDEEALETLRTHLGTYSFSALYQQRPTPAGGMIFKREWFKNIIDFAPPGLKWKRGYDLAVSTRTESDYTASFRCAFDKQGNLYISGGFRRRIEFPEQRRYILDRMANEPDTEHGVELALHGQALLQELRRDPAIRGKVLRGVKVSTDKITRALTWSPLAEEGKVILVRTALHKPACERGRYQDSSHSSFRQDAQDIQDAKGGNPTGREGVNGGSLSCETEISPRIRKHPVHPVHPVRIVSDWISDLLDELAAFPNGTHDDQIDAISIAVQMANKRQYRAGGFLII